MAKKILVAYATTYGSSKEIAEAIAGTLGKSGLEVELQPARNVKSLAGFQAVVLGAPLYMFRWHRDAIQFLKRHEQILKQIPTAVFASGPFHDKEDEWKEVHSEINKELAKFPWFTPALVEVFGGKFDPTILRFPWSWVPAMKKQPPVDIRDWDAIRAWAEKCGALVEQ